MAKVKVTKIKSAINRPKRQKATLEALGLRKMNSSNELEGSPQVLGMINKVKHLLKVENL
jgi:large subunit ribosomal protein L30